MRPSATCGQNRDAGRADSLNAAIAAAVLAFHIRASWNGGAA